MASKLLNLKGSEQELKCSCCGKLLSVPPIYWGESVGNICGRCYEHFEEMISKGMLRRAITYELLAKHLEFPCFNKHTGCEASLKWGEVQEHESNCTDVLACPMGNCSWQGTNNSVVEHMCNCHPSLHLYGPINNNLVLLAEGKSPRKYFTKVLDQYFVLTLYSRNYKFCCDIQCVHTHHEFEHKFYRLKFRKTEQANSTAEVLASFSSAQNYNHIQLRSLTDKLEHLCGNEIIASLPLSRILIFKRSEAEIEAIEKKYNVIKPLNKQQISNIISKHQTVNLKQLVPDLSMVPKIESKQTEKFFKELECPICSNYMSAPIFFCLTGHSICKACKPKLQVCPTCRSNFTDGRNFALENLTNLQYACKFAEFGCQEILKCENLDHHLRDCSYRTVKCFFNHYCKDKIPLINVKDHFLQKHSQLLFKEEDVFERPISTHRVSYHSIIFGNEVFILRFESEGEKNPVKFNCGIFGLHNAEHTYVFELQFVSKTNNNLKFVINQFCKPNVTDLENDPLVVPIELLKSFTGNEPTPIIYYKCIISKI